MSEECQRNRYPVAHYVVVIFNGRTLLAPEHARVVLQEDVECVCIITPCAVKADTGCRACFSCVFRYLVTVAILHARIIFFTKIELETLRLI